MPVKEIVQWAVVSTNFVYSCEDAKETAEKYCARLNKYGAKAHVVRLVGVVEIPEEPVEMTIGPFKVRGIHRDIKQGEAYFEVDSTGIVYQERALCIMGAYGLLGECRFPAEGFTFGPADAKPGRPVPEPTKMARFCSDDKVN